MRLSLTRRGRWVVALVVVAIAMATLFGPRALNAVVGPGLVVLAAGAVQVARAEPPTVRRDDPPAGFPGETRTTELEVEGEGIARVEDAVDGGLAADGAVVEAALPATISHEVELLERGEWQVGPVTVEVTDVLGLVARRYRVPATAAVLVYPRVYSLRGDEPFSPALEQSRSPERGVFDEVREYVPGDPLRDVDWKASAKSDGDLYVTEFASETDDETLTVVATAASGYADGMAAAAASVVVFALEAGLSVGVRCPGGEIPHGRGGTHRRRLLEVLARTGDGDVDAPAREGVDLRIHADGEGVTVIHRGRTHEFAAPSEMDAPEPGSAVAADAGGEP